MARIDELEERIEYLETKEKSEITDIIETINNRSIR